MCKVCLLISFPMPLYLFKLRIMQVQLLQLLSVPSTWVQVRPFAGFAGFRLWVCRIRGIYNFVLLDSPFCSSGVDCETAPTPTHTFRSNGNSEQQALGTVQASFSSVFGIVLDVVALFSCFITPFSGLLALSRGVIASFSNVSHRLGTFSHQFWA